MYLACGGRGRSRLSEDPAGTAALSPSCCVPQVKEALAVLQAHQATELTKVNVPESRWVGAGRNGDGSS